jgi:hypothetical protein
MVLSVQEIPHHGHAQRYHDLNLKHLGCAVDVTHKLYIRTRTLLKSWLYLCKAENSGLQFYG